MKIFDEDGHQDKGCEGDAGVHRREEHVGPEVVGHGPVARVRHISIEIGHAGGSNFATEILDFGFKLAKL